MSSLFPLLRSLLGSPSRHDGQRAIQQTIKDRDRGGFTTPERQQDHVSYHDTGLRGQQGALIVLEAIATNPFASKLTLSHNSLGDSGTRQLAQRIKFLRGRRAAQIKELNLATNAVTDDGFTDLLRGWDDLSELYLSNNQITLQRSPSPMLSIGTLSLLSLTSNPINCLAISELFRNPSFSPNSLKTLHLSACALDTSVAFSIAEWLEDHKRSGKLEWLAVNGNNWGIVGCERIVWALARKGGNKNLVKVEMLACDQSNGPTDGAQLQTHQIDLNYTPTSPIERARQFGFESPTDSNQCRDAIDNEGGWKALLEKCEFRNQVLRSAARRAALGVLAVARTVLLSSPGPKEEQVAKFKWFKLPGEVQFQIWRWVALLSAFPGLENHYESAEMKGQKRESNELDGFKTPMKIRIEPWVDIPDPLTTQQLTQILRYAQDRETLEELIYIQKQFLFDFELNQKGISNHRKMIEKVRTESELDRLGQEHVLSVCGCQKFEGEI